MGATAFLQASLHDAAALLVGAYLDGPVHAGLEYKVRELNETFSSADIVVLGKFRGFELVQKSLQNMVAIAMGAHEQGMAVELLHDSQELIVQCTVVLVPVGGDDLN